MVKQGTRVLVTGGAGFIGAHLTRALVAAGAQVRVLDDLSSGKRERLAGLFGRLDLLQADVRNGASVGRAANGAQAVVHLAGPPASGDVLHAEEVALGGTLNVLEAVRRMDRRVRPRVVLCGSGSVYGKQSAFVLHEELPPHPATTQAVMALAMEQVARVYHQVHGVQVVCLRLFRTFGPEEDPARVDAGVVARFIHAALEGRAPVIFGDGQQTRDLVYIDNVVAAIEGALRAEATGEPLNVASGEAVAINFLWKLVLGLSGKPRLAIDPTYTPAPPWEPQHVRPQIARACKTLGWAPSVRLRDGLLRTVNHQLGLRDVDPYSWFAPRAARARERAPTTPPPPPLAKPQQGGLQQGGRAPLEARERECVEVADDDLLSDEGAIDGGEVLEWAPVPVVPGLGGA
jgi:UDP-glucose 4-epimerase